MLNGYFVIERRGKFAIELESEFQIWGSALSRALRFNTYSDAEDMLAICGRGAKIVLKTAPSTNPISSVANVAKIEQPSTIAPSLREYNQELEKDTDIQKHWDMVPAELRSFDIFQYIPDGTFGDPGPIPEEF